MEVNNAILGNMGSVLVFVDLLIFRTTTFVTFLDHMKCVQHALLIPNTGNFTVQIAKPRTHVWHDLIFFGQVSEKDFSEP